MRGIRASIVLVCSFAAACTLATPSPTPTLISTPSTATATATPAGSTAVSPDAPRSAAPPPTPSAAPSTATERPSATPVSPRRGLDFQPIALPVAATTSFVRALDIAANETQYVVLGTSSVEASEDVQPHFWTSTDGLSWYEVPAADWTVTRINDIVAWQGEFIAAGNSVDDPSRVALWSSTDGRGWQRLPDTPDLAFITSDEIGETAYWIDDLWIDGPEIVIQGTPSCDCALGGFQVEWRSRDGSTWRRSRHRYEFSDHLIRAGPRLLAVDQYLYASDSGGEWEQIWRPESPEGYLRFPWLSQVGTFPNGYLAVGRVDTSRTDDAGGLSTSALVVSSVDGVEEWIESNDWPWLSAVAGDMTAFASLGDQTVVVGAGWDPSDVDSAGNPNSRAPYAWVTPPGAID